jgi:hypothetical protein
MAKFCQKPDSYRKVKTAQKVLSQQPVGFPTAITHKSLTVWRHFMDHRKTDRVGYRNGIQSFQSFSQSEAQRLNPDQLRFCLEAKISSDIGHQNSITAKPLSERSHMSNGLKVGELPNFVVFNSEIESFGNSYIFTFSLLLFALYRILYLLFECDQLGVSNVFMAAFLDEHERLPPYHHR